MQWLALIVSQITALEHYVNYGLILGLERLKTED